jgi:hypothetical protein
MAVDSAPTGVRLAPMNRRGLTLATISVLIVLAGCGREKAPRYTIPIGGYPYPFGTDVKRLLGREQWEAEQMSPCRNYVTHWLRNPPKDSRWSKYSSVAVMADSAGALEGFSAACSFASKTEARNALLDILSEIRRRYGDPTDSTVVNQVLIRRWQDQAGNRIRVDDTSEISGQWIVGSGSARMARDCHPVTL